MLRNCETTEPPYYSRVCQKETDGRLISVQLVANGDDCRYLGRQVTDRVQSPMHSEIDAATVLVTIHRIYKFFFETMFLQGFDARHPQKSLLQVVVFNTRNLVKF